MNDPLDYTQKGITIFPQQSVEVAEETEANMKDQVFQVSAYCLCTHSKPYCVVSGLNYRV